MVQINRVKFGHFLLIEARSRLATVPSCLKLPPRLPHFNITPTTAIYLFNKADILE